MKKTYISFDEAVIEFNTFYGYAPEYGKMMSLYHRYRNEWKQYNSFVEWLSYQD